MALTISKSVCNTTPAFPHILFVKLIPKAAFMIRILLVSAFIGFTLFTSAQVTTIHHPEAVPITLERVSLPLVDIPQSVADGEELNGERAEHDNPSLERAMPILNSNPRPIGADPALQPIKTTRDSTTTVNVLSNWEGISANIEPSDNCLAVGPNHVVQMVNNSVSTYMRIWDKAGNVLVNNMKVKDFSGINDCGDPNLIYDQLADRYVLLVLYSCSSSKLEVCVSQTEDPTGGWYVYSFSTPGGFPDYPKISMWGDSYFITTNSNSPTIWALDRTSMLAGLPFGFVQKFSLSSFPSIGFQSASPITFTGNTLPPPGSPAMMLRVADDAWGSSIDSDHLEMFEAHIDWIDTSLSSVSGPINLPTPDYNSYMCGFNSLNCIPQPNTNKKLDPLGNIVMDKVQYRNFPDHESIICSHVVNADGNGKAGVRWYELRNDNGSWYCYQRSTYSPDSVNRWMSTMSINDAGSIALGYNVSSGTTYPGARIVGRSSCDGLNLMTSDETTAVDGLAANGSNRYGDYNGMVTDPVDGSFWFSANYNPTSNWSTNVTHFTIDACVATGTANTISSSLILSVKPVPASTEIEVSISGDDLERLPLQIVDLTGKVVLGKTITLNSGLAKTMVDVHSIQNGFYLLKAQTSAGPSIQRIIIQH